MKPRPSPFPNSNINTKELNDLLQEARLAQELEDKYEFKDFLAKLSMTCHPVMDKKNCPICKKWSEIQEDILRLEEKQC